MSVFIFSDIEKMDAFVSTNKSFEDYERLQEDVSIRSMENEAQYNSGFNALFSSAPNSSVTNADHPCGKMDINQSHCKSIVHEFTSSDHWFSSSTEILLAVLYCVAIILGILGNAIVCYIVIKFKHLHKPRNFLILNLSVSGIVMCVLCMPFSLIRILLKNWHLGEVLCRLSPTLQTLNVFVSTFTIVAIAMDRYTTMVHARREEVNKKFVYYAIFFIWIVSILLCVPMMVFHEVKDVYPEDMNVRLYKICMEVWPSAIWKKVYTTFILLTQYVTPLAIISALHGRICHFLRVQIGDNPRTDQEASRLLRDVKRLQRNMLLLTVIAVTFAISWLPLTILNTLADFDYTLFLNKQFNYAYAYCLLAAMCSAFLNPVIYGWYNSNFRNTFLKVVCSIRRSMVDMTELATIKNDSRGNSNPPYRFYSSFNIESSSLQDNVCKSISSKSSTTSSRKDMPRSESIGDKSLQSLHSIRLDTLNLD
ncbi:Delta-type opioid receptor [Mactra antiquata]